MILPPSDSNLTSDLSAEHSQVNDFLFLSHQKDFLYFSEASWHAISTVSEIQLNLSFLANTFLLNSVFYLEQTREASCFL